jgi:hypothetical protein
MAVSSSRLSERTHNRLSLRQVSLFVARVKVAMEAVSERTHTEESAMALARWTLIICCFPYPILYAMQLFADWLDVYFR